MMYAFRGMSYNDSMSLPIPIRKWLLRRFSKQKQEENHQSTEDTEQPLTQQEKAAFIQKSQQVQPNKSKNLPNANIFSPMRNTKK